MRTARASVIALASIVLAWSSVAEAAPAPFQKPDRRPSRQKTIAHVRQRLTDLGVVGMRLERTHDNRWSFRCTITSQSQDVPAKVRGWEETLHVIAYSTDEDGLEAMQKMLRFVELHAKR